MGIPAYFSHIVRQYPKIYKKSTKKTIINNLLIDSNSVMMRLKIWNFLVVIKNLNKN